MALRKRGARDYALSMNVQVMSFEMVSAIDMGRNTNVATKGVPTASKRGVSA